MLSELHIQDIVLIDRLTLSVGGGLTALTGETGAGKSILLDSLDLATGGRSDKGLVRQGAQSGIVSASFEVGENHPVWSVLQENGLPTQEVDGLVMLRRVQGADGRARAFINDMPVSVALLRQVGETLIEVHGQHQAQGFLHAGAHRALLDDFGDHEKLLVKIRADWAAWRAAQTALADRVLDRDAAQREAEWLRFAVAELEKLTPEKGEETSLAERRSVLMAAEKVVSDLNEALTCLAEDGLETRLSGALGRVEQAAARLAGDSAKELTALVARLDGMLSEVQEARSAAQQSVVSFEFDPQELEVVEQRLFSLRAAARKYNTGPDELGPYLAELVSQLQLLEHGEADLAALKQTVATTQKAYLGAAEKLSLARRKTAKKLDKAVAQELTPLKLGTATFAVSLDSDVGHAGPDGHDKVSFLIATNPGAELGALKQIASGGELSRFVLALKAALVQKDGRTVIIFDEVDAGVGGAVADAVGERLAGLAKNAQVLVVTHSPQVAARAGCHWQVSKSGKTKVTTSVALLDDEARLEEIARMLSGAKVTKAARAAAGQLLASAKIKPKAKRRAGKKSAA